MRWATNIAFAGILAGAGCRSGPSNPAGTPADELAMLPPDTNIVVGINWSNVIASPLWKEHAEPWLSHNQDIAPKLAAFKTECGFDPLSAITTIVTGSADVLPRSQGRSISLIRGTDRRQVMACAEKMTTHAIAPNLPISVDGPMIKVTLDGSGLYFTYVDDATLASVQGPALTKELAQQAAKGGLQPSAAFTTRLARVDRHASMWGLTNGSSPALDQIGAKLHVKPRGLFGSLNVTDVFTLDAGLELDSAPAASKLAADLNQDPQLKDLGIHLKKLAVTSEGDTVHLSAVISKENLNDLFLLLMMAGAGSRDPATVDLPPAEPPRAEPPPAAGQKSP